MDARAERVGLNEAIFRSVNERIEGLNQAFEPYTNSFEIVCECGDIECTERFAITRAAYEDLRSDPTLFAIVPGHTANAIETVVSDDAYEVVRKREGEPADTARATDPRADRT